jgi:hypothetical protein
VETAGIVEKWAVSGRIGSDGGAEDQLLPHRPHAAPQADRRRDGQAVDRNGLLSAFVSSTTDRRIAGHQVNSRVKTIGEDTMTITDPYGSVKPLRRLR